MNLLKILENLSCDDQELKDVLAIVKWVFNSICIVVPVIIIVLIVIDMAKVATAGNVDDKMKKEATQKAVTRIIYSIIIFLVPSIVSLIFRLVPINNSNKNSIINCWNGTVTSAKNTSGGNTNTKTIDKQNAKSLDDCNEAKGNWDTTSQICR